MLNQILVVGYWILAIIYIFLELTEDEFEKTENPSINYIKSIKYHMK